LKKKEGIQADFKQILGAGFGDFGQFWLGILYMNWPSLRVFWPLLVFLPCHCHAADLADERHGCKRQAQARRGYTGCPAQAPTGSSQVLDLQTPKNKTKKKSTST
jgi:hypothetical protein